MIEIKGGKKTEEKKERERERENRKKYTFSM